jgi:hypothetical protein
MRDNYGPNAVPGSLNSKYLGPQVILMDNWLTNMWNLLTHLGFLTFLHHDTDGFATWLFQRGDDGAKIWAYLKIKNDKLPTDRASLFKLFDQQLNRPKPDFSEDAVLGTILLEEGDVL